MRDVVSKIRAMISRHRSVLLLALILAAATAFRLHRLGQASLWYDECFSLMHAEGHLDDWHRTPYNVVIEAPDYTSRKAAGSWAAVWNAADVNPPLYPLLLRAWRDLFGENESAARGLSVAASIVAIVLLFDLGRTLINDQAALWACAIMAVAQPQVQYAQEARSYAMATALGMGACAAAARLAVRGPGWRRAVALAACLLGMLLTHFFTAGAIAALAVWGIIRLRGLARKQAAIALSVAGILFILLAVGRMLPQAYAARGQNDWLLEGPDGHIQRALWRAALLPGHYLCDPEKGTERTVAISAVLYILPFLLIRRQPAMLLLGLWLVGVVGTIFLVDVARDTSSLVYVRYTLLAAPAVYLMIAAIPLRWRVLRHGLPLLAVVHCLLALPDLYDYTYVVKGDWRELGSDVRHMARPGDLLVIASPKNVFLADAAQIFTGIDYYARPIPCPMVFLDETPGPALNARLHETPNVWVLCAGSPRMVAPFLPGWHLVAASHDHRYAGVVYRLTPDDAPLRTR